MKISLNSKYIIISNLVASQSTNLGHHHMEEIILWSNHFRPSLLSHVSGFYAATSQLSWRGRWVGEHVLVKLLFHVESKSFSRLS